MLDEFVPDKFSIDTLQSVLRLLLEERVSIRNLPLIFEAIAEVYAPQVGSEAICEHVRHRLGFQLVAEVTEADGALPLIQLSPGWEETFQKYQLPEGSGIVDVALPPGEFNRLANAVAEKIANAGAAGRYPAVVTSTKRRRFLHMVLNAKGIRNPVLSFEEIGTTAKPGGAGAGLMFQGLAQVMDFGQAAVTGIVLVFARIGAIAALLPGFGEQAIPARVKLAVGIAFTLIVWPMIAPRTEDDGPGAAVLSASGDRDGGRADAGDRDPADGGGDAAGRVDHRAIDRAGADLRGGG